MKYVTKKGEELDISFSFENLMKWEAEHPKKSAITYLTNDLIGGMFDEDNVPILMGFNAAMTVMIGMDLKQLAVKGISIEELSEILPQILNESGLGFSKDTVISADTSGQATAETQESLNQ